MDIDLKDLHRLVTGSLSDIFKENIALRQEVAKLKAAQIELQGQNSQLLELLAAQHQAHKDIAEAQKVQEEKQKTEEKKAEQANENLEPSLVGVMDHKVMTVAQQLKHGMAVVTHMVRVLHGVNKAMLTGPPLDLGKVKLDKNDKMSEFTKAVATMEKMSVKSRQAILLFHKQVGKNVVKPLGEWVQRHKNVAAVKSAALTKNAGVFVKLKEDMDKQRKVCIEEWATLRTMQADAKEEASIQEGKLSRRTEKRLNAQQKKTIDLFTKISKDMNVVSKLEKKIYKKMLPDTLVDFGDFERTRLAVMQRSMQQFMICHRNCITQLEQIHCHGLTMSRVDPRQSFKNCCKSWTKKYGKPPVRINYNPDLPCNMNTLKKMTVEKGLPVLRVEVIAAQGIPKFGKKQLEPKTSVEVEVFHPKESNHLCSGTSKVVQSVNPSWEQFFDLHENPGVIQALLGQRWKNLDVVVTLWNNSPKIKRKQLMGKLKIPLKSVAQGRKQDFFFVLVPGDDAKTKSKDSQGVFKKITPAQYESDQTFGSENTKLSDAIISSANTKLCISLCFQSVAYLRNVAQKKAFFGAALNSFSMVELKGAGGETIKVPVRLEQCRQQLVDSGGLELEGIFNQVPDKAEFKQVQMALQAGGWPTQQVSPHTWAHVILSFFKMLPENDRPFTTVTLVKYGVNYTQLLNSLTEPASSLAHWLLDLCFFVAKNSEANSMPPQSIGAVFATALASKKTARLIDMTTNHIGNLISGVVQKRLKNPNTDVLGLDADPESEEEDVAQDEKAPSVDFLGLDLDTEDIEVNPEDDFSSDIGNIIGFNAMDAIAGDAITDPAAEALPTQIGDVVQADADQGDLQLF